MEDCSLDPIKGLEGLLKHEHAYVRHAASEALLEIKSLNIQLGCEFENSKFHYEEALLLLGFIYETLFMFKSLEKYNEDSISKFIQQREHDLAIDILTRKKKQVK